MNLQVLSRSLPLGARNLHLHSKVNTSKPNPVIDSIIRVDHAGELGADRIYAGQMAVLGHTKMGPLIQHMWDQEKVHKAAFEELIVKHRVRPTALVPIWNVAGFVLGAGTALMGEKAAMACTVAVESVIVDHYNDQIRTLMAEPEKNKELMQTIQKFRDDEQEHHDCGIDHGAEQAPFYKALSEVIKFGCKTAIAISKGLLSHRNQFSIITARSYSTSAEVQPSVEVEQKRKWDLYSGLCIERKPVILQPVNDFQKKIFKVFRDLESERSLKSDHEVRTEKDKERAELMKTKAENLDFDTVLEQTAHEFEEYSNKDFDSFQFAPLISSDDKKNDTKSLKRKYSKHLFLLVNETYSNKKTWMFPQGIRKDSETLRQTAERILREKCGEKLKVVILGNAPCGFYKYLYPKSQRKEIVGAKVFFFKGIYISGQVELQKEINDFQWAEQEDFLKITNNSTYCKKISQFLINYAPPGRSGASKQVKQ